MYMVRIYVYGISYLLYMLRQLLLPTLKKTTEIIINIYLCRNVPITVPLIR